MRKILTALAILPIAITACSQEPTEAPAKVPSVEPAAPASASGNGSPPGAYQVTAADGTLSITTINADGTYIDSNAQGAVAAEGTYAVVDGKTCFMPITEGATPMCYTESAASPDGSFTATGDDGSVVLVFPADGVTR